MPNAAVVRRFRREEQDYMQRCEEIDASLAAFLEKYPAWRAFPSQRAIVEATLDNRFTVQFKLKLVRLELAYLLP